MRSQVPKKGNSTEEQGKKKTNGKSAGNQAAEPADGRSARDGRTQPQTDAGSVPTDRPRRRRHHRGGHLCNGGAGGAVCRSGTDVVVRSFRLGMRVCRAM